MPLDREVDAGMLVEELRIGLQGRLLIAANIGLVVIEVDVFYALAKKIFFRRRRRRRSLGHRRRRNREARRSLLGSAGALSDQVIGSGIARGHLLRSAGLHGADAVNRNVRGIRGLPA